MYNDDRRLDPDAAPDERVTSLLEAASAPTEPGPVLGELEALAAFRASHSPASRKSSVSALRTSAKVTVGAALGALLLTGGVGAAVASGSLPGAAQDTASELLSKVGVSVPAARDRPEQHDDTQDDSGEAEAPAGTSRDGLGEEISGRARDTGDSGAEKGAALSELASEGRRRAGERGVSRGHAGRGHHRHRHGDHDGDGHEGRHGEHRDHDEHRSHGEGAGDDAWVTPDDTRDGDARGSTRPTTPDEDGESLGSDDGTDEHRESWDSDDDRTDEDRESLDSADSESRP